MEQEDLKREAKRFLQQGKFEETLRLYNKALSREPNNVELLASRAGVFNCKRDYEKALLDIEKSLQIDGSFGQAYVIKGFALQNLGLLQNALESYELGQKFLQKGQEMGIKDLIQKCQKKIEEEKIRNQNLVQKNEILSNIIQKLKECDQFREYLTDKSFLSKIDLLTKSPQLTELLANQDIRIKQAIQYLLENLDAENLQDKNLFQNQNQNFQNPNQELLTMPEIENLRKLKLEAKKQFENQNYEFCLQICNQCLELDNLDLSFINLKMGSLNNQSRFQDSQQFAEKSLLYLDKTKTKDKLNLVKFLHKYAFSLWKQSKLRESCATYERCLKMCQSFIIQKEFEECQKELNYQQNPTLKEALEHKKLADQLFRVGKIQEAQEEYEISLKINKTSDCYLGLSNCLVKKKEIQKALLYVEEALYIQNNNVNAWAKKGFLHMMLNSFREAKASFELGLETDEKHKDCLRGLKRTKEMLSAIKNQEIQDKVNEVFENNKEIKEIIDDSEFLNFLQYLSTHPDSAKDFLTDQQIKHKVELLQKTGLLKIFDNQNAQNNQNFQKPPPVMVSIGQEMEDPTVFNEMFRQIKISKQSNQQQK